MKEDKVPAESVNTNFKKSEGKETSKKEENKPKEEEPNDPIEFDAKHSSETASSSDTEGPE